MNQDTPFFARFLESQDYPQIETDVKAGKPPGGGGGTTNTLLDTAHTMKYPSDGDDNPPSV